MRINCHCTANAKAIKKDTNKNAGRIFIPQRELSPVTSIIMITVEVIEYLTIKKRRGL
jgi:hypothetical protein